MNLAAASFVNAGMAVVVAAVCLYVVRFKDGRGWLTWIGLSHGCITVSYSYATLAEFGQGVVASFESWPAAILMLSLSGTGVLMLLGTATLAFGVRSPRRWLVAGMILVLAVVATRIVVDGRAAFILAQTATNLLFLACGAILLRRPGPFTVMVGAFFLYRGMAPFSVVLFAAEAVKPPILEFVLALNPVAIAASGFGFLLIEYDEARQRLIGSDAAKTNFLANMSHELRTPLNAIIGFSEVMHAQMLGELQDRYRGYAHDILSAGRHLLLIVNQLLDMAAIDAGRTSVAARPLILDDIVDEAVALLRIKALAKNIEIGLDLPASPVEATQDERIVRQILLNILSNAVKFSPAGSHVEVILRHDAAFGATVAIRDEGPGLAPDHLNRIFTPFWRADNSAARSHEGLGLGLAMSRRLALAIGGDIEVSSNAGRGSVFTLRLPLRISGRGGRGDANDSLKAAA